MRNLNKSQILATAVAAVGLGVSGTHAANITWDGGAGGTGAVWNDAVNWGGDVLPGSADTVLFTSTGTGTTSSQVIGAGKVIALNASQSVYQLSINSYSNAPAFVIGSAADVTNGNTLTLTNVFRGDNNGNTQTIAANVVLAADSTWNIINGYNGSVAVTGAIGGSGVSLTKVGSNTLTLNGNNTFTGSLRALGGGITLGGSSAYTGATTASGGNVTVNFNSSTGTSTSTNFINSGSALVLGGTLGGGSVTVNGKNAANALNSQAFNGVTLNAGASSFSVVNGISSGKTAVNVGAITRNVGGTVNFAQPTVNTAISAQNGYISSTGNDAGNILGGYATVGNTDWAANNGTNIVAYTGYTNDVWAAGNNTTVTTSSAPATGSTTHSLRFAAAGANTVTLDGTNTITSGGILVTAGVGNNLTTITGGTLQGASGKDLVVFQNNTSNALTIASAIVNNTDPTALTKSGSGTLNLTGALSYTGGTIVNAGTLALNAGATNQLATTGSITVSGGTLNLGTGSTQSTSGSVIVANGTLSNGTLTKSGTNYDVRNGTISSKLAGSAGLDKTTPGVVTLSNTVANTYTGDTTITEGTLIGGGAAAVVGVSGNLIVGSVSGGNAASYMNNGANVAFSAAKNVTVYSNGTVNFGSGAQNLSGTLNILGGSVTGTQIYNQNATWNLTGGTLSGTFYVNSGSFNILASATTSTIGIGANAGSQTYNVNDGAAAVDLLYTGTLGGANNLNKNLGGTMVVVNNNGYTGATNINAGVLRVTTLATGGSASGIGAGAVAATNLKLGNGATLQYTGTGHSTNRLFTIDGSASGHGATLDASGTGAAVFNGVGNVAYGTNNQARTLTLTGTSTADNTLGLTINNNGSGAVSVVKNGAGRWILGGANGYTGTTSVDNGTLLIATGASLGNTTVTVNGDNAVLGGTGTIGGNTTIANGTLAAGASIGTLAFGGDLTINDTLAVEVDGTSTGTADVIEVLGVGKTLYIANATVNFSVLSTLDDPAYVFAKYTNLNGTFAMPNIQNLPSGYQIDYAFQGNQIALVAVPEPAAASVLALAGIGLVRRRRALA